MERKTLKFKNHLADLVLSGEKTLTWRLYDDKNISVGDAVDLLRSETKEKFAEALVVQVWERELGSMQEIDFDGHEKFVSKEDMFATYRAYYGSMVNEKTIVKIIKFKLIK